MKREEARVRAEKWTMLMSQRYDDMIAKARQCTKVYNDKDVQVPQETVGKDTDIVLVPMDSVSAIHKYKEGKTAVLNFASYKNPGGGFIRGMMAQEESLCHHSYLYNVLKAFSSYYAWNGNNLNSGFYTNRALYTPSVLFDETTRCDVITCAAPNASRMIRYKTGEEEKNKVELIKRILFVLNIAAAEKVDTLILGAYGCGVFKQNPEDVARLFKYYLENNFAGCFNKVIFAIPDESGVNYQVFKEHLGYNAKEDRLQ